MLLVTVAAIVILLLLIVIEILYKRYRIIEDPEIKESTSYGLWLSGIIISITIIFCHVFSVLNDGVVIYYNQSTLSVPSISPFVQSFKLASILIGLGFAWFFLWYVISFLCSIILLKKKNDIIEMASNNYIYFLIRSLFLISLSSIFLNFFTIILKSFLPTISIPFFH